jgi:hypothetical protein
MLIKSIGGADDDVSPDEMGAALERIGVGVGAPGSAMQVAQPTAEKPRAMFHDPYSVMDWGGWRQRPSSLTYETLRQMSVSNTVIAAIINLRVNQVAAFCTPQQQRFDRGYRVILRDRRDKKKGMSPAEQKEAEAIERFLETTAVLLPNEKPADRDSFRAFCKKGVRDVLTYDQWCFEKIRDRAGRPSRFVALPSETIRPAVSDVEHMDPAELRSRVSHVQIYENTVISEFSSDEIAFCVQNPRSDIRVNGFGFSPIEQIVRLVTAWLFGFEYNTRFFTQGSAIKGLINIKGAIPDRQLRAFRRMWYSMISGVGNAWKTPIVNAEGLEWHSMHTTNREMEYGQWMDWLTKLICAIYGADPVEINFIFGNSGQTGSLNQSRPNAEEVTESKDKGLRPLLDHLSEHLNRHIIWDLNEDFEFAFTGFDSKAEEQERKALIEKVKTIITVNEARAEIDEEPLPGELGDVILDSTWLQYAQAKEQAAQQAVMGMGGGGEGQGDNHFDDLFGPGHGQDDDEGGPGAGRTPPQAPPGQPKPPAGFTAPHAAPADAPSGFQQQQGGMREPAKPLERSMRTHPAARLEKSDGGRASWVDLWLPRGRGE